MLLVTTADQKTWGGDEELLFLGGWCLTGGGRGVLRYRKFRVLPYHWDDRAKLHRDGRMLWERYEALLPDFVAALNVIHATEHDAEYWRRAFGQGLLGMLTVMWDRLESLSRAAQEGPLKSYYRPCPVAVQSYADLMAKASASDTWNAAFDALLMDFIPGLEVIPLEAVEPVPPAQSPRTSRKQSISRLAGALPQRFAFVNMGVPLKTLARLALSQGQLPVPISAPPVPASAIDDCLRARFRLDCGDDPFGKVCSALIPRLFSAVALEGYGAACNAAKHLPRSPRAIITAQAQYNEVFTVWAAELSRKGVPLGVMQHGGHYGTDLTELAEDEEIRTCDAYFTWGWGRKAARKTVPVPALKLIPWKEKTFGSPAGDLLIIYDAGHRYPYRIFSTPIAAQRQVDNARQVELLHALSPELRDKLRLRLHPVDDGYGFREILVALGLRDRIDTPKLMVQSVNTARICIVANNSTSMLEVLSSGLPTFIFYDPQFAEVRDEATPFFDALAAAGILHTDPLVLAAKVRDVWADPSCWWNGEAVQAARKAFVTEFCVGGDDWTAQWRTALAMLATSRGSKGAR